MAVFADPFAPKKIKGRQPSALSVYPDLTPEDEDSLLSSLGSTTLGGLSMIGSILDTPGSWVRNTLSGRNPFEGTFDSSLRASGRDVLENYGLLNPNQEGFHPIDNPRDALGDVAGFGVEVALDPLSYVLGGARAVNAGGAAAAKLGVLPRAAYDAAINVPKKGLRGLGAKLFNRPLEESTQLLRTGAREARMTEDFTAAAGRYATEHAGDDINKVNAAIESAAQSVGKTSQELYDSKDPLGFLVGFGNPFSHKPAWFGIGKDTPIVGGAALKAAKFLDKGQDALRYSLPGRIGAQLFSKPAGMAISKPGQLSAGTMYDAERIAGETGLGQTSELATLSRKIGLPYDVEQRLLGKALEIPNPTNLPVTSLLTTAEQDLLGPNANLFDQLVSKYKDYVNSGYDVLKATGRNTPELRGRVPGVGAQVGDGVLPPMIDYAPRYAAIPDHYGSAGLGKKIFNQSADSTLQRSDELADIPRHVIDDLALDPTYKDVNRAVKKASENVEFARRRWKEHTDPALKELARNELTLAERVRDNAWEASDNMVLDKMGRSRADIDVWKSHLQSLEEGMRFSQQQGETIGADVLAQVAEYKRLIGQHREIGKTLTGLPDEAFGKPFWVHPLEAFARNVSQNLRAASASREMMKFATQFAEPGGKGIPLFDVLHGSKFAKGASPDITDRATQEAIFYLQAAGHETDALKRALHVAPDGTSLATDSDLLRHFTVPESIAGDMQRIIKGFKDPEVLKPSLEIIDWITSKFKTGVTTPWPSFFTRNFTQGTWQNFVIGAASKRWYQEAQRLISGEKPTAAILDLAVVRNAGIRNVDEAAEFLRRSFYQYNVSGQSFKNEITGGYKPIIENMRGNVPGMDGNNQTLGAAFSGIPAGIKEHAAGGESKIGKAWAKASAVPKAVIDAGAKMNTWSESLHRTAGFLSMLEQGFDPAVAAAKIRQAHVDYADLSDVEKVVMRRLVPFYAWSRKMTPTVLKELYETPGGYSGQLAQLSAGLRGRDEGFLPDYLQGGLGMPINDQDETGKQTFLTNIDLAPEAVFEPLSMGPNAAKDTGLKLLGMMNPLIKAPLEAMTGRQFFTGRDMRDLHSTLGLPPALDQFLSNSPLARVKSTASQLGQMATGRKDPLNGLANTFTGLRFSDVDIPKHKSIKTRELIQDEMRREDGVGVFEKLYVPPEILKDLTPRQIALLKLYAIEQKRAADRRKAQKQP